MHGIFVLVIFAIRAYRALLARYDVQCTLAVASRMELRDASKLTCLCVCLKLSDPAAATGDPAAADVSTLQLSDPAAATGDPAAAGVSTLQLSDPAAATGDPAAAAAAAQLGKKQRRGSAPFKVVLRSFLFICPTI